VSSKRIHIIFLFIALILCHFSNRTQENKTEINYVLGSGAGHYNYAPSAIQDDYKIRYVFLCENKNPFEIVDYLYLHKGIPTKDGYSWQQGTTILSPSKEGWDKTHVYAPGVSEFKTIYRN